MRGRLAEKDLAEWDDNYQVVEQEVSDRCRQEPDFNLELARLLLTFMVRSVDHH